MVLLFSAACYAAHGGRELWRLGNMLGVAESGSIRASGRHVPPYSVKVTSQPLPFPRGPSDSHHGENSEPVFLYSSKERRRLEKKPSTHT